MNLREALEDLTAQIRALGLNAVINPQDMDLPSAWVTPGVISFDYMDAETYTMSFDVYLISSNNDVMDSLTKLSEMLELIRIPFGIPEAAPVTVTLPNHGGAMPALLITLQMLITKD